MKLLITGGAGYIGSALTSRLLSSGHEVTVVDNLIHGGAGIVPFMDRISFKMLDIREIDPSIIQGFDVVVNLAALVGEPLCRQFPEDTFSVNHQAAMRIAKACEQYGRHLIALSTASNYGLSSNYAREGDPLYPVSDYARSKVQMELDLEKIQDLNATILRCATAFGLSFRNRFDLIVQQFVVDAFTSKKIVLQGESFYRPLCHVDDIARAIVLMLGKERNGSEVYNVGGYNFTKRQIAEMVAERVPCEIVVNPSIPDPRNYRLSFEKIKRAGFLPIHSLKETIDGIAGALENGLVDTPMLEQSVNVQTK